MRIVKKTILGTSAFALVLSPTTIFLNDSKNHIIQNISDEIKNAMNDTSLIFRKEIVANSHSMNVASVGSEFDQMMLSDVSSIQSDQTVANYNQTVYDYSQANDYLTNQVDNTDGFAHVDSIAQDENTFKNLSNAITTVKNSFNKIDGLGDYFDAQQGINPSGMNNLLDLLSRGVSEFSSAINVQDIDATLTSTNKMIAPFVDFILPDPPAINKLQGTYKINTYQDMHNYLISQLAYYIIDYFNPSYEAKESFFNDENNRNEYDWSNSDWSTKMYSSLYNAATKYFTYTKLADLIDNQDLGLITFPPISEGSLNSNASLEYIKKSVVNKISDERINENYGKNLEARNNSEIESVYKIADKTYEAKLVAKKPTSSDVHYQGEIVFTFTTNVNLLNVETKPEENSTLLNDLMELIYILNMYMEKFEEQRTKNLSYSGSDPDDHLFSLTQTNVQFINSVKAENVDYNKIDASSSLMGVFNILKGVLLGDADSMGYTRRALKILFQFEDGTQPHFDDKTTLSISDLKLQITGSWSGSKESKAIKNGIINILDPILESLVNSDFVKNLVPSEFVNFINFKGVGYTASSIIASILADNDLTDYFGKLNLGWLEDFLNLASVIPFIKEIQQQINSIISAVISTAETGAFKNVMTQILTLNLKTQFIPKFNSLITVLGLSDSIPAIPNINIRQTMDTSIFGSFKVGSLIWEILANYQSITSELSSAIDLFRSITSDSAASEFSFFDESTGQQILPDELNSILGYEIDDKHAGSNVAIVLSMIKAQNSGKSIGVVNTSVDPNSSPEYGASAWKRILGLNAQKQLIISDTLISSLDEFARSLIGSIILETPINYYENKINSNLDTLQYDRNKTVKFRTQDALFTNELVSSSTDASVENLEYNILYEVNSSKTNIYNVQVYRSLNETDNKWKIKSFSIGN